VNREFFVVCKYWSPVIAWMAVIFVFSTDFFSSSNTSSLIAQLLTSLLPSLSSDEIDIFHEVLRKLGHWSEYFILAVLLARALRASLPRPGRLAQFAAGIAIAALYAASDEWHQTFVPSRTASVIDVMIDSFGALCGLLAFHCTTRSKRTDRDALSQRVTDRLRKKT
jgi:VanZ family protein